MNDLIYILLVRNISTARRVAEAWCLVASLEEEPKTITKALYSSSLEEVANSYDTFCLFYLQGKVSEENMNDTLTEIRQLLDSGLYDLTDQNNLKKVIEMKL